MTTVEAGVALIREWETTEQRGAFLLRLTSDDLEAISRLALQLGHPVQVKAKAFLRAIYALS